MKRFTLSSHLINDVHPRTTPVGYTYRKNAQANYAFVEDSSVPVTTSFESAVFSISSRAAPAGALSAQGPTQHLSSPLV